MRAFGKTSLASLQGIHPNLVKVMDAAVIDSPVDFTITNGVRTVAMQQALWFKGRDTEGHIVNRDDVVTMDDGIIRKSNHQVKPDGYGHAVDLYPYIDGEVDYDNVHGQQSIVAAHIKSVANNLGTAIEWGGDWTMAVQHIVDPPHFELKP